MYVFKDFKICIFLHTYTLKENVCIFLSKKVCPNPWKTDLSSILREQKGYGVLKEASEAEGNLKSPKEKGKSLEL